MSCTLIAVLAAALMPQAVQAPESVGDAIRNYTRVGPGLAAAGQPSPEALGRLAEDGFRTVVNLRTEAESGFEGEAEAVEAQGLRYVSIPVSGDSFSSANVDAVAAILDDDDAAPVLLHCASSNRVGAVLAVLAAREGATVEAAIEAGRAAGLRSDSLVTAVERVIAEERGALASAQ